MKICSFGLALSLALTSAISAHAAHFKLGARAVKAMPSQMAPRFTVLPAKHFDRFATDAQAAAGATIPQWARTVAPGGVHYTYRMVGRNPFVAQTTQTTNIKAVIIPMKMVFTNATLDPAHLDATCSPRGAATVLVKASPLFNSVVGYPGGTYVGTGEYTDLFQRANYYSQTKPNGINPNYHVNLTYTPAAEITVNVNGPAQAAPCGFIGVLDFASWDQLLQQQVFPALASASPRIAPPTTLPIFLLYNVVLADSGGNCCILGYHSAFNDPAYSNAFHTYSSVEFDTNGDFGAAVTDTSAMSHEIAEWMDDPSGTNPTPSWGNIGQVSGCQGNLEVGDPLSGTLTQIYMPNGYTYHVQDLAFTSWFYRQHPSTGVNGWYSFLGNFLTPAAACP